MLHDETIRRPQARHEVVAHLRVVMIVVVAEAGQPRHLELGRRVHVLHQRRQKKGEEANAHSRHPRCTCYKET